MRSGSLPGSAARPRRSRRQAPRWKKSWSGNRLSRFSTRRFPPAGMLVLSPASVTLYVRNGTQWQAQSTVPVASPKPWPADLRGHLRLKGASFQALLPGLECDGASEPALTADCRASADPWLIESGSHSLLLAQYASGRNYFEGRVTTQNGQAKTVPPFFSAAAAEQQGTGGCSRRWTARRRSLTRRWNPPAGCRWSGAATSPAPPRTAAPARKFWPPGPAKPASPTPYRPLPWRIAPSIRSAMRSIFRPDRGPLGLRRRVRPGGSTRCAERALFGLSHHGGLR